VCGACRIRIRILDVPGVRRRDRCRRASTGSP
jgi:hypothetical protein